MEGVETCSRGRGRVPEPLLATNSQINGHAGHYQPQETLHREEDQTPDSEAFDYCCHVSPTFRQPDTGAGPGGPAGSCPLQGDPLHRGVRTDYFKKDLWGLLLASGAQYGPNDAVQMDADEVDARQRHGDRPHKQESPESSHSSASSVGS